MPKTTIYLPDPLAAEVKSPDIHVSAVCQRALEQEVRRVTARAAVTNDLAAVEARLRETIEEDGNQARDKGFAEGAAWAREVATFRELEAVAGLRESHWISTELPESLANSLGWQSGHVESGYAFVSGVIDGAGTIYDAVDV
jgi:post-segregation antitoxin (ccd killing protein)